MRERHCFKLILRFLTFPVKTGEVCSFQKGTKEPESKERLEKKMGKYENLNDYFDKLTTKKDKLAAKQLFCNLLDVSREDLRDLLLEIPGAFNFISKERELFGEPKRDIAKAFPWALNAAAGEASEEKSVVEASAITLRIRTADIEKLQGDYREIKPAYAESHGDAEQKKAVQKLLRLMRWDSLMINDMLLQAEKEKKTARGWEAWLAPAKQNFLDLVAHPDSVNEAYKRSDIDVSEEERALASEAWLEYKVPDGQDYFELGPDGEIRKENPEDSDILKTDGEPENPVNPISGALGPVKKSDRIHEEDPDEGPEVDADGVKIEDGRFFRGRDFAKTYENINNVFKSLGRADRIFRSSPQYTEVMHETWKLVYFLLKNKNRLQRDEIAGPEIRKKYIELAQNASFAAVKYINYKADKENQSGSDYEKKRVDLVTKLCRNLNKGIKSLEAADKAILKSGLDNRAAESGEKKAVKKAAREFTSIEDAEVIKLSENAGKPEEKTGNSEKALEFEILKDKGVEAEQTKSDRKVSDFAEFRGDTTEPEVQSPEDEFAAKKRAQLVAEYEAARKAKQTQYDNNVKNKHYIYKNIDFKDSAARALDYWAEEVSARINLEAREKLDDGQQVLLYVRKKRENLLERAISTPYEVSCSMTLLGYEALPYVVSALRVKLEEDAAEREQQFDIICTDINRLCRDQLKESETDILCEAKRNNKNLCRADITLEYLDKNIGKMIASEYLKLRMKEEEQEQRDSNSCASGNNSITEEKSGPEGKSGPEV